MVDRLQDKVCIVTGAASGLGQASAIMFAAEGAAVVCADVNEDGLAETKATIEDAGGTAMVVSADLTDGAQAEAMTTRTLDEYGQIDVVYACAGVAGPGTAEDTSDELWDRLIAINLKAKWLAFRYALPHMKERGQGSVVVQASIGGVMGVPRIFPYAVAKGGCISMVKQTAIDMAPFNIRVNGIAPGTIMTPLVVESYEGGGGMSAAGGPSGLKTAHEKYPLNRLGTPEELAYLATYVASDEAGWTTGQIFVIDGGITIGRTAPSD